MKIDLDLILARVAVVEEVFKESIRSEADFAGVLETKEFVMVDGNRVGHTYLNDVDVEFTLVKNNAKDVMLSNIFSGAILDFEEDLKFIADKYDSTFLAICKVLSESTDLEYDIQSNNYDQDGAECEEVVAIWRTNGRSLVVGLSVGGLQSSISIIASIHRRRV